MQSCRGGKELGRLKDRQPGGRAHWAEGSESWAWGSGLAYVRIPRLQPLGLETGYGGQIPILKAHSGGQMESGVSGGQEGRQGPSPACR